MRAVLALLLFSLAIMCFNLAQSASKMGEIGIFTEATSWMDVASANSAAQIIKKKTKLIKKIEVYNDKDIGIVKGVQAITWLKISLYVKSNHA